MVLSGIITAHLVGWYRFLQEISIWFSQNNMRERVFIMFHL